MVEAVRITRSAILEQRQSFLDGEQHALHVRVEGALIVFFRDRSEQRHFAAARDGEDDVDVRVLLLNGVIEPVDIGKEVAISPARR